MKKIYTLFAVLFCVTLNGQDLKWKVSMEAQKVFIENKSQFDGRNNLPSSEILFATEDAPSQIFFSKNGLTYRLEKREHAKVDEREERQQGMTHEQLKKKNMRQSLPLILCRCNG